MPRNIYHVELKESSIHEYFTSLAALYEAHSKEVLGVSKFTLDRVDWVKYYENEKVIIRRGVAQSRGDILKSK